MAGLRQTLDEIVSKLASAAQGLGAAQFEHDTQHHHHRLLGQAQAHVESARCLVSYAQGHISLGQSGPPDGKERVRK